MGSSRARTPLEVEHVARRHAEGGKLVRPDHHRPERITGHPLPSPTAWRLLATIACREVSRDTGLFRNDHVEDVHVSVRCEKLAEPAHDAEDVVIRDVME